MEDIIISINKDGIASANTDKIGNKYENKQKKIRFKFIDKFIDGDAYMEYEINGTKYFVELDKDLENEEYSIIVKSCLLTSYKVKIDLKIDSNRAEENSPVFVSTIVSFIVEDTIGADNEEPEYYPTWLEAANEKLSEMDTLNIDVNKEGNITTLTLTRKDGTQKEVEIEAAGSWGQITGTLSNQTDLMAVLNNKVDKIAGKGLSTNDFTNQYINSINNKVDKINGKGLSTNDFTTKEKNKLANLENYDDSDILEDIEEIQNKIPSAATSSNQLADKDFVNHSIITNTAYFRGTFNSIQELEDYDGEKSNNDYAFVKVIDSEGNSSFDRYKYVGPSETWEFEYSLTNSSFTAQQLLAINSGITSERVNQYDAYETEKANVSDIPTKTSDLTNDSGFLTQHQSLSAYRTSANQDIIDGGKVDKVSGKGLSTNDFTTALKTKLEGINLSTKQDTLVSGSNIKTINNKSILGSGNITIQGEGGSTYTAGDGIDITDDIISVKNATDSELGGVKVASMTQAQYDALQTKDTNTFYSITDASGDLPEASADTLGGVKIWTGTQTEYNAIITKSNSTIYLITN